jgi:hypothetical protein
MPDDNLPPPPPPVEPSPAEPPPPAPVAVPVATDASSPVYGAGKLSAADDKLYCTLAHLFSLIIWLWKKDESPAVDQHGKEALNFHLTGVIILIGLYILGKIPFVGCLTALASAATCLGVLVLSIIGALKANDGYLFRYPINFRILK